MKTITLLISIILLASCKSNDSKDNELYISNAEKFMIANTTNEKVETFKVLEIDSIKPWTLQDELGLDTLVYSESLQEIYELREQMELLNDDHEWDKELNDYRIEETESNAEMVKLRAEIKNASTEQIGTTIRFSTKIIYKDGSTEIMKLVLVFNDDKSVNAKTMKKIYGN